ncbi:MAG: helix-turn-helix domain-containing protein [Acidobacteriota bacterium]|nr:helix-turn-helix domain-containing protein [Acidobacteriota bacterium]
MDEPVRWVTKAEAAEELEISLSTLDRMIRRGEVEVSREGRRVYVRMHGPEYPSDEELLHRSIARERELERTVRELDQSVSEWKLRASELERERDEARESAATARGPYVKLEIEHRKEVSAHRTTKWMLNVFSVIALVLLVLLVGCVLLWWFVLR